MSPRLNFDTIRVIADFTLLLNEIHARKSKGAYVPEDTKNDISCLCNLIATTPILVDSLKQFSQFQPVEASPDDLFVIALSKLRDSGDIDCLVRSLNWQQNDIAFLSNELKTFERTLVKLDDSLRKIAKLRDDSIKLRKRNATLLATISQLREDKKTLKSIIYEVKKKNPCKNR